MSDEFFIGYQPSMARGIASFLRKRVIAILLIVTAFAAVLVAAQKGFAPSTFEFGTHRSFEGIIRATPYPHLLITRPDPTEQTASFSRYYLVTPGKKGAKDITEQFDGQRVVLEGTLIYRDTQTMIERVPGSVHSAEGLPTPHVGGTEDLGIHTLVGEIVDSKCYLGVMKPGNLKPHRSCAIRCISGGIPPVFLVRDTQGHALYFMMTGKDGRAINEDVLDMVALDEILALRYEVYDKDFRAMDSEKIISIPTLMQLYLNHRVKICSEPAIDRIFKTIDFLGVFDVENASPHTRKLLLDVDMI